MRRARLVRICLVAPFALVAGCSAARAPQLVPGGVRVATDTAVHTSTGAPPAADSTRVPVEERRDAWLGSDKLRHFLSSAFATTTASAALQAAHVRPARAEVGAVAFGVAVGIGKEWLDWRRYRAPSLRDLAWDVAGVGAGAVLMRHARR